MSKAKTTIVWHDRYTATGRPYPKRETMCRGKCEGMGVYPYRKNPRPGLTRSDAEDALWDALEKKRPTDDGYHFIRCAECKGTGLRESA